MRDLIQFKIRTVANLLAIIGFSTLAIGCGSTPQGAVGGAAAGFGNMFAAGGCAPVTGPIGFSGQALKALNTSYNITSVNLNVGAGAPSGPYYSVTNPNATIRMAMQPLGAAYGAAGYTGGYMPGYGTQCPTDGTGLQAGMVSDCYQGQVLVQGFLQAASLAYSAIQTPNFNLGNPGYGSNYGGAVCVRSLAFQLNLASSGQQTNLQKVILYQGSVNATLSTGQVMPFQL